MKGKVSGSESGAYACSVEVRQNAYIVWLTFVRGAKAPTLYTSLIGLVLK